MLSTGGGRTTLANKLSNIPYRALNLHEYQSKDLLDRFNVATQVGQTVNSPRDAKDGTKQMMDKGIPTVVLKAQVFAGGRGKGQLSSGMSGGGIQFVKSPGEAEMRAEKMLGHYLRTHQTGAEGLLIQKVLLTEAVNIKKELYLAVILDREKGGPVIVASQQGGVDIEEVANSSPDAIQVVPIDIQKGVTKGGVKKVAEALLGKNPPEALTKQVDDLVRNLYKLFVECDASQVEINPLAITEDGRVLCVDAKLNFDDNAAFRQKELFAQEDTSLKDVREMGAESMGMNWITMDGNIGCLVNGAGLAMATMDLISFYGGSPANFLDLGGGATKEQVLKSFELLMSDPKVKTIFVNIFGGITRCDVVAQGIIDAANEIGLNRPLVVRLVGNCAEEAREMINSPKLSKTGLKIMYVQDFAKAAETAVYTAETESGSIVNTSNKQ